MHSYGLPFLITVFLWWFSTGAILLVVGLPRATRYWSFASALLAAALAVYGLLETRDLTSVAAAYIAFCCALVLWGANEVGFLLGLITGARKTAAPQGASWWARFASAAQSILHHEVALALTAGGIALCLWGSKNQIGLYTFLLLWGMRLSTKFNIFLGVPNITVQFLPAHLLYLKQFFANRPMNLLFPFSVTASTLLAGWLIHGAAQAMPGSFEAVGYALLASLTILGVLEHWFLVIPLPFADLWAWGLAGRADNSEKAGEMSPPHIREAERPYTKNEVVLPMDGMKPLFYIKAGAENPTIMTNQT
jgi:putative photosynthetic complex assembly protein 2